MLISNPPYIATEEIQKLMEEVRLHDPYIALDGKEMSSVPQYHCPVQQISETRRLASL